MLVFGREIDVMFGVLLPIGFLLLVAIMVTFGVISSFESEKRHEAVSINKLQNMQTKLDKITTEIEQIKKEIEKQ
jgi:hypothetical protein